MKVLAIDPGALRCGWASVEKTEEYTLIDSGITGLARDPKELFGHYRRRLLLFWLNEAPRLFNRCQPDIIVSELVPAVGGGNFIAATQAELTKVVVTTAQVIAEQQNLPWQEIAANTIKRNLTGDATATKVQIRNAVIAIFPELKPRKKALIADESDAIGIGLVGLGYKVDQKVRRIK